jgi:hypothetical protein
MTAAHGIAAVILAAAVAASALPAAVAATKAEGVARNEATPASAHELQAFARAAREVFRVRKAYAPKVQSAKSEIDARDFIVSAEKEMGEAIRHEGLTVARYNEILKAAQRDAALAARIQTLVDKAAAGK